MTVGDLKKELEKYDDDIPLIYSHDDEGNEHQFVQFLPSVMFIKNTKDDQYRFLKHGTPRDLKTLCIN